MRQEIAFFGGVVGEQAHLNCKMLKRQSGDRTSSLASSCEGIIQGSRKRDCVAHGSLTKEPEMLKGRKGEGAQ
ncbi:histone acetyltransferase mst2 [Moniliophthora roreri]|nr:histone acetyltransferase mst2 [Moniliophthora roreri]